MKETPKMNWDEFRSEYVRWTTPGQVVEGDLRLARKGDYMGREFPELILDTEDGTRIVSASQANLMRQLAEDPPAVGDWVRIEYLGEGEARPGQSPPKLFLVTVTHKSRPTASASDLI
jgi:hypothetical protein